MKDKPDSKNGGDGATDSKPEQEHTVSNPTKTEPNTDIHTQARVEDITEKNVENVSDSKDTLLAETNSAEVSSPVVEDTSSSPNGGSMEINSSSSASNENRNKVSDDS